MRNIPLLRIGLGLMALIALVALGVNLGQRDGRRSAPPTPAATTERAEVPLDAGVAAHWRELAPVLTLLDSATAIGDPERRQEALKAAEDLLERAEERSPGAGELPGSPRREYRNALEGLRRAVDEAEEPTAGPEALGAVAEARRRLEEVAGSQAGGSRPRR